MRYDNIRLHFYKRDASLLIIIIIIIVTTDFDKLCVLSKNGVRYR